MPDHWAFVGAAYGLTAAVLLLYWRRLDRKEREVDALRRSSADRQERLTADRSGLGAGGSRAPSRSGPPRPDPGSQAPLQ